MATEARDSGLGLLPDDKEFESISKVQWEPRFNPYRAGQQQQR